MKNAGTSTFQSSLRPVGAIFRKDTITHLRQTRSFVGLVAGVCGCSTLIYGIWPKSKFISWNDIGVTAAMAFSFFSYTTLICGALMVAGVSAATHIGERERGVWDMLMTTLVSPWGLVAAKFISVLTTFTLILVGCAPVVATLYFLIGIDPSLFLRNGVIITATLAAVTSLASGAAAWTRRTGSALRLAYAIALLNLGLYLVPIYLVVMLIQLVFPQTGVVNSWIFVSLLPSTSPVYLMSPTALRGLWDEDLIIFVTFQLTLTAVGFFVAVMGVNRRRMIHESETRRKRYSRTANSTTTGVRSLFTGKRNPVFIREWKWGLFPKRRGFWFWIVTGAAASLLISSLFVVTIRLERQFMGSGQGYMLGSVFLHGLVVLLAVPSSLGNIMTKERENQTGLLLATTTLSPASILWGKLQAALRLGFLAWLVSFFANLLLMGQLTLVNVNPSRMLLGHITLLFCTFCVASITVYASTMSKKTRGAVALSGFLGFMAVVGFATAVIIMIVLIGGSADTGRDGELIGALFFVLSPVGAYFSLFEGPYADTKVIWFINIGYLVGIAYLFTTLAHRRLSKLLQNGFDS